MDLDISEIEGDAIFFYRVGEKPTPEDLYNQTVKMYNAFHITLKEYQRDRICNCGACSTVNHLQIKFVSHYGKIVKRTIHNYLQLMGSDVTTVHKLLKNNIDEHEYLLWSDKSLRTNFKEVTAFSDFQKTCMDYDGVGDVYFNFISLKDLKGKVPDVASRKTITLVENPIEINITVNAGLNHAYETLTNLDLKPSWTEGLNVVKYNSNRVHRLGSTHDCVLPLNTIKFETIEELKGKDEMVYTEFSKKSFFLPAFYQRFVLSKNNKKQTFIQLEIHFKAAFFREWFTRLMFYPLMRKSLKNLKKLIEN